MQNRKSRVRNNKKNMIYREKRKDTVIEDFFNEGDERFDEEDEDCVTEDTLEFLCLDDEMIDAYNRKHGRTAASKRPLTGSYAEAEYEDDEYAEAEYEDDEYADEEYEDDEYADDEYEDDEYADDEYEDDEYAEDEYEDDEYADDEYEDDEYADNEYEDDEYADDEYEDDEYADDEYEDEEYDGNTSMMRMKKTASLCA